jgi:hypothetical protein
MMRNFIRFLAVAVLLFSGAGSGFAGEFKMNNGDVYRGEATGFDDEGMVVRLDIGGFSGRLSWSRMTQETLKELAKNPQAARYAEPFIELTAEEQQKQKQKKEIVVKPVPRLEPLDKRGFFAAVASPVGLLLLGALYLANLFAGFEVAVFRQRPMAMVVITSAILPVLGPLLFLTMPAATPHEASTMEGADAQEPAHAGPPPVPGGRVTNKVASTGVPSGGGLSIAQTEKQSSTPVAEPGVYKRGEFTFNRRFFETKFPGFFRVVPSEAEKDLVLVIRAAKNEFVAKRISRISSNEMHVQTLRGGTEAMVPFGEIIEVQVRHKEAKS